MITIALLAALASLALGSLVLWFYWLGERRTARQWQSRARDLDKQLAKTQRLLQQAGTRRLKAERAARRAQMMAQQLAEQEPEPAAKQPSFRQVLAALDSRLAEEEKGLAGRDEKSFRECHAKREAVQTIMYTLISNRLDQDLAKVTRGIGHTDAVQDKESRDALIRQRAERLLLGANESVDP